MVHAVVSKDLLVHIWFHISVLFLRVVYVLTQLKQVIQISMGQVYISDSYLLLTFFMKEIYLC